MSSRTIRWDLLLAWVWNGLVCHSENVTPVFQCAHPVPFALCLPWRKNKKRLWATLIVCVPKTDGSVRICGDNKGTVNSAIQTEQFPIPTLEGIQGGVSSWNKFTKVYQELVLNGEAQKLRAINSHKGPIHTLAIRNSIQPCNLATIQWESVS